MNTESLMAQLKQQTEDLVKRGGDVRAGTERLVSEASVKFHEVSGGLASLATAVADGAVAGARQTVPEQSASVLRAVVDGLTDGLTKSAQALKLTLEESSANGTRFAKEDLAKIGQDFRSLGSILVDIVTGSANALGGHAKEQAATLAAHAKQTLQAAWPPLESALHAAQHEPVALGREALSASASAARQAAGVLFGQVGIFLQKAGHQLRQ